MIHIHIQYIQNDILQIDHTMIYPHPTAAPQLQSSRVLGETMSQALAMQISSTHLVEASEWNMVKWCGANFMGTGDEWHFGVIECYWTWLVKESYSWLKSEYDYLDISWSKENHQNFHSFGALLDVTCPGPSAHRSMTWCDTPVVLPRPSLQGPGLWWMPRWQGISMARKRRPETLPNYLIGSHRLWWCLDIWILMDFSYLKWCGRFGRGSKKSMDINGRIRRYPVWSGLGSSWSRHSISIGFHRPSSWWLHLHLYGSVGGTSHHISGEVRILANVGHIMPY